MIAGLMIEGLRLPGSPVMNLVRGVERKRLKNPENFDLPGALAALGDQVAKLVGTP